MRTNVREPTFDGMKIFSHVREVPLVFVFILADYFDRERSNQRSVLVSHTETKSHKFNYVYSYLIIPA
jgi:hypothetical protein